MSAHESLCFEPAHRLASLVRSGGVSASAVVRAFLDRIERVNPQLNALVTVDAEGALRAAAEADRRVGRSGESEPLLGVPVTIKDIIFTRGLRTTGGSRLFRDFTPDADAIAVERLKHAGAVVLGKTNTSEFGHKPVTENALFGATRNPCDPALTPGGSSGGSAAAVAAGMCALSIGNDGGGSIRIPAAFCGVVGLKPSLGLVPQYPGFAGWELLGHTGPIASCVADAELALSVIGGSDPRDPASCRVFPAAPVAGASVGCALSINEVEAEPEVAAAVMRAVEMLREAGCQVSELKPSWTDPERNFTKLVAGALLAAFEQDLQERRELLDPSFVQLLKFACGLSAAQYARACAWQTNFTREVLSSFAELDFLLLPTTPVPAFALGEIGPRTIAGRKVWPFAWMSWAYPFNLTGQPAISIPCGATRNGLPVGLQIVGKPGADTALLRFARRVEALLENEDSVRSLTGRRSHVQAH